MLTSFNFRKAAWTLKTRALTGQVYVDEVDWDEEGIAEMLMDDNVTANIARPGTSLRLPGTGQGGVSQGVRLVLPYMILNSTDTHFDASTTESF